MNKAIHAIHYVGFGDRKLIQDVLVIITSGQELDLQRFAGGRAGRSQNIQN
jgi:hypothetical protein